MTIDAEQDDGTEVLDDSVDSDASDDLEASYAQIAEQLSSLALTEESPSGFDPSWDQFEPDDVSFESNGWMLRVLQVQGWLFLDGDIDPRLAESDPAAAATALLVAVGATPESLMCEDQVCRPTLVGAGALASRLSSAEYLRDKFLERRETLTRQQATARWKEDWEEEPTGDVPPAPIRAVTDLWPIQEFWDKATEGLLNLSPSYQRGDVWPMKHSQQLIISILRGIPLPSVILLAPQAQGVRAVYEVVDGKQRLTAILRFIGKHPQALQTVKEAQSLQKDIPYEETFENDYKKFKRLWKTHRSETLSAQKEAEYYFPFRLPATSAVAQEELRGHYYCDIRDISIQIGTLEETVRRIFEQMSSYRIPLIQYIDTAPRQIHEVFHLYNRQGKHLNAEEIRNALYHHLDLMKLLLVASGDNRDIKLLAPFVPEADRWRLEEIGDLLINYRFGTARYRRTKLLSWLTSLILCPSVQEDGEAIIRSTAKQIDEMLLGIERSLEKGDENPLANHTHLCTLVEDLHQCLDVHSSVGGWAPAFQDDRDGSRWQELQLVASLVGVFLVCAVREDPADFLEAHHSALIEFTSEHLRPDKSQNRSQWGFIGKVALGLVDRVGIDRDELGRALLDRYGVNCLPTLEAASEHYEPRVPT